MPLFSPDGILARHRQRKVCRPTPCSEPFHILSGSVTVDSSSPTKIVAKARPEPKHQAILVS